MQHKRPPLPVLILLLLLLAVGMYYGIRALFNSTNGQLRASGAIEATTVNISPELAGKVREVLAAEGQSVRAGEALLRLDDSLLRAQHALAAAQVDSARAALSAAQTQFELTLQSALAAEQKTTANAWRFSAPDEFHQPAWYFHQAEQIAAAQREVEAAKTAWDEALQNLTRLLNDMNNAEFLQVEKRLAEARAAFLTADQVKTQADQAGAGEGGGLQNAAYDIYNQALDELQAAQRAYDSFLTSKSRQDVLLARGSVVVAQQRYDAAYARLLSLKTGAESPAVLTARRTLEQAEAALNQAQANLALLDTQIEKLTVYAPMDGVILTRNVEAGEFVQPGAIVMKMADLNSLTITVYVPEDRYGQIRLGQQALVNVDSFPGETFRAEVTFISDQAEFTPRNVQTVEGRSSTVYAVKLRVADPQGKLKIGMPADVTFTP